MRPRKHILLCASEANAHTIKYLLETRGPYTVAYAANPVDALDIFEHAHFDLVLAELTKDANELIRRAKMLKPAIPAGAFSRTMNSHELAAWADFFIGEQFCTSEEILNRVGIAIRRKRGPKRGEHRVMPVIRDFQAETIKFQVRMILKMIDECNGSHIRAAEALKVHRNTITRVLREGGIKPFGARAVAKGMKKQAAA